MVEIIKQQFKKASLKHFAKGSGLKNYLRSPQYKKVKRNTI